MKKVGIIMGSKSDLQVIEKDVYKRQVLIEKSVKGFKEIEFEMMRDKNDNVITVCGMENIDPVGVHTGDSIVVAPIMTLNDHDLKMLGDSAVKLIKALKICLLYTSIHHCVIVILPYISV